MHCWDRENPIFQFHSQLADDTSLLCKIDDSRVDNLFVISKLFETVLGDDKF